MLEHWLIELVGHVSSLSEAQLKQIEKSLPATRALVDLLSRARPLIEQAQSLYAEAQPLIDQAKPEWQTVGPAAQILIDVISHHINRGSSQAEAAETVRAALSGSIKSVTQDHLTDREMSCATVFGGTGFVGRRVVRHLHEVGTKVCIVSRHQGRAEDDGIEHIAADANDKLAKAAYRRQPRIQRQFVDVNSAGDHERVGADIKRLEVLRASRSIGLLPRQEGLDDAHAAATARAGMRWRFRLFGLCSLDGIDRDEWNCEQVTDVCNILGAGWAGQQAIVTDAIKALWQQVHQEAADELMGIERHHPVSLPTIETVILPLEGGDAMGAAGEIAQDFCRSPNGRLSVLQAASTRP